MTSCRWESEFLYGLLLTGWQSHADDVIPHWHEPRSGFDWVLMAAKAGGVYCHSVRLTGWICAGWSIYCSWVKCWVWPIMFSSVQQNQSQFFRVFCVELNQHPSNNHTTCLFVYAVTHQTPLDPTWFRCVFSLPPLAGVLIQTMLRQVFALCSPLSELSLLCTHTPLTANCWQTPWIE